MSRVIIFVKHGLVLFKKFYVYMFCLWLKSQHYICSQHSHNSNQPKTALKNVKIVHVTQG